MSEAWLVTKVKAHKGDPPVTAGPCDSTQDILHQQTALTIFFSPLRRIFAKQCVAGAHSQRELVGLRVKEEKQMWR
jgi:hypothetical protein